MKSSRAKIKPVVGKRPDRITEQFVQSICVRLKENKRIRRSLPIWGRVHIDRQLPFLCVYRHPSDSNDAGTVKLLQGEASLLTVSGATTVYRGLRTLVRGIAETLSGEFGAVLIVEVWSASPPKRDASVNTGDRPPVFRLIAPKSMEISPILVAYEEAFSQIKIMGKDAGAVVERGDKVSPPGFFRLLQPSELKELGAYSIGLEVQPVFRDPDSGQVFPLLLRSLHRQFAIALKRVLFEFARTETNHTVPHFLALGRRAMVKTVWDVDTQLAEVSNVINLLLYLSPTNTTAAFAAFKRSGFEKTPKFVYRPRPIDPGLLKRRLFSIPLERIEDPAVAQIFRETLEDLDGRVTLLSDRGSSRFLYSSLRVFGGVPESLLAIARELLDAIPSRSHESGKGGSLDATGFANLVASEIQFYRQQYGEFAAEYEIREDITGLLCSRGNLLIGKNVKIPQSRAKALIQHEIGTHLVTYYNGRAQPFKQLYLGLAGYDELQEGLAVLSEYLVGGLSRPRMRLLAARVVAVYRLIDGASFVETFRELVEDHNFERRTAFTLVMRVYRGGGLTKDAAYLKGLVRLLRYLKDGGDLHDLYIGKFNTHHVPFIRELLWRKVLHTPPVRPRFLDEPQIAEKLAGLKKGLSPSDLVEKKTIRR